MTVTDRVLEQHPASAAEGVGNAQGPLIPDQHPSCVMRGKKRFRGFFDREGWGECEASPTSFSPRQKETASGDLSLFQAWLQRAGLLQKFIKLLKFAFSLWPEWLPKVSAPPVLLQPWSSSPPGPSARVSSLQMGDGEREPARGSAGGDDSPFLLHHLASKAKPRPDEKSMVN